jgi:hypothetical protein
MIFTIVGGYIDIAILLLYFFFFLPFRPCLLPSYFHPKRCGDGRGLVFTQYSPIPSIPFPTNTLVWWRVFNIGKNTLV